MKKFLILSIFICALFAKASAQVTFPNFYLHDCRNGTYQVPLASKYAIELTRDSVHSGTTVLAPTASMAYAQNDSVLLAGSYKSGIIQTTLSWISGTTAGSIYLQGSGDGNHWVNLQDTATIGTLTSAGTSTYIWELPGIQRSSTTTHPGGTKYSSPVVMPYAYYRVYYNGTGTWCGTFYSYLIGRQ